VALVVRRSATPLMESADMALASPILIAAMLATMSPADQCFVAAPRERIVADCAATVAPGVPFAGLVLQVIDGRTLCVAQGPTADQWVRVTLADAADGASRGALMAAAFGRRVVCVTGAESDTGLTHCALGDVSLGVLASQPTAAANTAIWR
jgi:hypothetical protein